MFQREAGCPLLYPTGSSRPMRGDNIDAARNAVPVSKTKDNSGLLCFSWIKSIIERVLMSLGTLSELLIDELKDLYSAEKQVTRALSKLAKAVKAPELKDAFLSHLEETKSQVARLEQIFVILGKKPTGKTCVGMKGILEESLEVLLQAGKGVIRDAALISTVRRVEHYEIAGYVSAQGLAKLLGHKDIAALLGATLVEEQAADKKLSVISKQVNLEAKLVG
jgi:ferritin-like metal-binding protein YciE